MAALGGRPGRTQDQNTPMAPSYARCMIDPTEHVRRSLCPTGPRAVIPLPPPTASAADVASCQATRRALGMAEEANLQGGCPHTDSEARLAPQVVRVAPFAEDGCQLPPAKRRRLVANLSQPCKQSSLAGGVCRIAATRDDTPKSRAPVGYLQFPVSHRKVENFRNFQTCITAATRCSSCSGPPSDRGQCGVSLADDQIELLKDPRDVRVDAEQGAETPEVPLRTCGAELRLRHQPAVGASCKHISANDISSSLRFGRCFAEYCSLCTCLGFRPRAR